MASDLADLRDVIKNRKDANRIHYEPNLLLKELPVPKQTEIKDDVKLFCTSLSQYLEKWSKEVFAWMKLISIPSFEKDIEPPASLILLHHPVAGLDMDRLFDEFPLLQQYVRRKQPGPMGIGEHAGRTTLAGVGKASA